MLKLLLPYIPQQAGKRRSIYISIKSLLGAFFLYAFRNLYSNYVHGIFIYAVTRLTLIPNRDHDHRHAHMFPPRLAVDFRCSCVTKEPSFGTMYEPLLQDAQTCLALHLLISADLGVLAGVGKKTGAWYRVHLRFASSYYLLAAAMMAFPCSPSLHRTPSSQLMLSVTGVNSLNLPRDLCRHAT